MVKYPQGTPPNVPKHLSSCRPCRSPPPGGTSSTRSARSRSTDSLRNAIPPQQPLDLGTGHEHPPADPHRVKLVGQLVSQGTAQRRIEHAPQPLHADQLAQVLQPHGALVLVLHGMASFLPTSLHRCRIAL